MIDVSFDEQACEDWTEADERAVRQSLATSVMLAETSVESSNSCGSVVITLSVVFASMALAVEARDALIDGLVTFPARLGSSRILGRPQLMQADTPPTSTVSEDTGLLLIIAVVVGAVLVLAVVLAVVAYHVRRRKKIAKHSDDVDAAAASEFENPANLHVAGRNRSSIAVVDIISI